MSSWRTARNAAVGACGSFLIVGWAFITVPWLCADEPPAGCETRVWRVDVGQVCKAGGTYRSRHFLVHTDLCEAEIRPLLVRMEHTLVLLSQDWRSEPRGIVECYLVGDLAKWPSGALPDRTSRMLVSAIGGATYRVEHEHRGRDLIKTILVARATPEVVDHEAVHAYFLLAFGETGPDWFQEGVAEMARHSCRETRAALCSLDTANWFRAAPLRSTAEVASGVRMTSSLSESLLEVSAAADQVADDHEVSVRTWLNAHDDSLDTTRAAYRWSWALCHLLRHNPNYTARFRLLGQGYMSRRRHAFDEVFGSVRRQLDFELAHFVTNLAPGYRVDLCRWEWGKPFRALAEKERRSAHVSAARGYQASGLLVEAGKAYAYEVRGAWSISQDGVLVDAAGHGDGRGRLVGVVQRGERLDEPFELGPSGVFTLEKGGRLHLRCQDAWHELADNSGRLLVTFSPCSTADHGLAAAGR